MINVKELITDIDFCQPNGISVIRQSVEVVRHIPSVTEIELKMPGIITIANDTDIEKLPEADRSTEAINIFTLEKLYTTGYADNGAESGFLSDIVLFEGIRYSVKMCRNNAQYGYCKSTAVKTEQAVI